MKQWVDITTIDNSTPFSAVRWKEVLTFGYDKWFSEVSGLVTDNMSWFEGETAELGYFGGHRMNASQYTCSFHCDELGIDTGLNLYQYQYAIKDGSRTEYYDNTIEIGGETYYEVDFSLWDGWVDGVTNLYMPYAVNPFVAGEIYVLVGSADIIIDKTKVNIKATGGTATVTVTAADDWTAIADGDWFTADVLSGTSGDTVVTITAGENTGTTRLTGSIVFTCGEDTVTLTLSQSKPSTGFAGWYIGESEVTTAFIGETEVPMGYIGGLIIG